MHPLLRDPRGWIATGFGSGLAPNAPGTWGTIASLVVWLPLAAILPWWAFLLVGVALFLVGIWASNWVIAELKRDDPGVVVMDEWVGMAVSLFPCVYIFQCTLLLSTVLSLITFRVIDIAKPWPVSWADRTLSGGFGAMLDDLLAGVVTAAVLSLGLWLIRTI